MSASVAGVLARLEQVGSRENRDGMARYGIVARKVFGVSVGTLRGLAKELGRDHALAEALWRTGWYEARMLAIFVDDPAQVTAAQMRRWARDFENWALCDTACFALFDRTAERWAMVDEWGRSEDEWEKRAAFAMLASLSVHDKAAGDAGFRKGLALIARAGDDERNFVKKAVSWALRSIGKRNPALHAEALALAEELAGARGAGARWVGKDAARELASPAVRKRVAGKARAKTKAKPVKKPARPA